VIKLVQIVLAGEDGPIGKHLGQDAPDRPDVDRLCVALKIGINMFSLGKPESNKVNIQTNL